MYKVHSTTTVTDSKTGRKTYRTVEVDLDEIERGPLKAFGVKVGDEAFLAGWDLKLRDVKVDPMADARKNMAAERTHHTRGKGGVPNGHGGES